MVKRKNNNNNNTDDHNKSRTNQSSAQESQANPKTLQSIINELQCDKNTVNRTGAANRLVTSQNTSPKPENYTNITHKQNISEKGIKVNTQTVNEGPSEETGAIRKQINSQTTGIEVLKIPLSLEMNKNEKQETCNVDFREESIESTELKNIAILNSIEHEISETKQEIESYLKSIKKVSKKIDLMEFKKKVLSFSLTPIRVICVTENTNSHGSRLRNLEKYKNKTISVKIHLDEGLRTIFPALFLKTNVLFIEYSNPLMIKLLELINSMTQKFLFTRIHYYNYLLDNFQTICKSVIENKIIITYEDLKNIYTTILDFLVFFIADEILNVSPNTVDELLTEAELELIDPEVKQVLDQHMPVVTANFARSGFIRNRLRKRRKITFKEMSYYFINRDSLEWHVKLSTAGLSLATMEPLAKILLPPSIYLHMELHETGFLCFTDEGFTPYLIPP